MTRFAIFCSIILVTLFPVVIKADAASIKSYPEACSTDTASQNGISKQPYDIHIYHASSKKPVDDSLQQSKIYRRSKWSKWLGIGSLASLLTPIGLLSLPAAIVAIIMGNHVKTNSDDKASTKNATTGIITGWVTVGLFAIAAILFLLLLALFSAWWQ